MVRPISIQQPTCLLCAKLPKTTEVQLWGYSRGFAGLSGAILTQIYTLIHSPETTRVSDFYGCGRACNSGRCSNVYHQACRRSQTNKSYVSGTVITIFTLILFVLLLFPIVIPVTLSFFRDQGSPAEESLYLTPDKQESSKSGDDAQDIIFSEMEDEKPKEVDLLSCFGEAKENCSASVKTSPSCCRRSSENQERRPHRGEDFTMMEALIKADLWLMFFSLLLGSGSGLTVIDNLGQMSESLGYDNTHVFFSMISIFNFLAVLVVVTSLRESSGIMHTRGAAAMAVAQVFLAIGHFFLAMGWPGQCTLELFLFPWPNPAGSLIMSGVLVLLASSIYDRSGETTHGQNFIHGATLFPFSSFLTADETLKCKGTVCFFLTSLILFRALCNRCHSSMILVYRTSMQEAMPSAVCCSVYRL
ncbi:hypothetical protein C2S52_017580 [Perilla frutescens var. hirtella]|nr:hypothetical protein C2S52_017580 [Perilla frutescens var. hirtella]